VSRYALLRRVEARPTFRRFACPRDELFQAQPPHPSLHGKKKSSFMGELAEGLSAASAGLSPPAWQEERLRDLLGPDITGSSSPAARDGNR